MYYIIREETPYDLTDSFKSHCNKVPKILKECFKIEIRENMNNTEMRFSII
jgi:hypothetical protein